MMKLPTTRQMKLTIFLTGDAVIAPVQTGDVWEMSSGAFDVVARGFMMLRGTTTGTLDDMSGSRHGRSLTIHGNLLAANTLNLKP